MDSKTIKGNRCNVATRITLQDDTPKRVIRPQCGDSETYRDLRQSVGRQRRVFASKKMGRSLSEIASRNRYVTFKPGKIVAHRAKFRIDLS